MKQRKNRNGTVTAYNHRNEEMHNELRRLGHKVVEDRRKKSRKYACRRNRKTF